VTGRAPNFSSTPQQLKVIVAGLEPGQQIPAHPESLAVYHFLAGEGVMTVDDENWPYGRRDGHRPGRRQHAGCAPPAG
jgi:mannose-6-phosphate isomerase-like protein (cupin superfamily)